MTYIFRFKKKISRLGQGAALDFMSWLGLELSPDVDIDDLIRGNKSERSSSVDWFLTQSSFPKNAFHNQDEVFVFKIFFNLLEKRSS